MSDGTIYLHPDLNEMSWFLDAINPKIGWKSLPEDGSAPNPGDVVITPQQVVYEGVTTFIIPDTATSNPTLSALAEFLVPSLDALPRTVLEASIDGLMDQWDSEGDIERLKRMSLVLWNKEKKSYAKKWLALAKLAWLFGFKTVQDFSSDPDAPPVPLYQLMGYQKWALFAKDILEVMPSQASQMKWVWQVYHVQLGWSPEKMLQIGKAKLGLALGKLRAEMEKPDSDKDKVKELLGEIEDPGVSFSMLHDKLQVIAGNGSSIQFQAESTYMPEVVATWMKPKTKPDMVHLDAWIDNGLTENAVTLVFSPSLDAETLTLLKSKLGKTLRWDRKTQDAEGEEEMDADVESSVGTE